MAQVNINIHGKPYGIACDEGQEKRVQELGRYVDSRLREIAAMGAATAEPHLLVLTALMMSDEIYELRETVNNMSRQLTSMQERPSTRMAQKGKAISTEEEREILSAIDHLSARIDNVADRLAKI